MSIEYLPVYVYSALVFVVTLVLILLSSIIPPHPTSKEKYMPYESGIQTEAHLQHERFPLRHYLVALVFLIFDIEVIFLYPWAVVGKSIGAFAFYEMVFFLVILLVGFFYIWKKRGLQWE